MPDGNIVMIGIFIFPAKRNLLTGTEPGMEPVGYQSGTTAVYRPPVTLTLEGPFTALSRSCHHDSPQTCLDRSFLSRYYSTNSFPPGSGQPPSGIPRSRSPSSGWSSFTQRARPLPRQYSGQIGGCVWIPTPLVHQRSPEL